ncbi:hypothetical protein ACLKA7_005117 [Drosophila subpalustris]
MKYTPGNIWTKGPEFLLTDERNWPSTAFESNLDDSLERKKVVFTVQQELLFDMDRFSNYLRLKRTFGWILRFVKRLRHQNVPDACGELAANELRLAEVLLCKLAQNQAYSNEIKKAKDFKGFLPQNALYIVLHSEFIRHNDFKIGFWAQGPEQLLHYFHLKIILVSKHFSSSSLATRNRLLRPSASERSRNS